IEQLTKSAFVIGPGSRFWPYTNLQKVAGLKATGTNWKVAGAPSSCSRGRFGALGLFSSANRTDIQMGNRVAPIEKAVCQFVSGDAFDILHVPGRVFTAAEDRVPWGHPYFVISYDYWRRRFQIDL